MGFSQISPHGYLAFGAPASIRSLGSPWPFPVPVQPSSPDPALLVVYFAKTLVDNGDRGNVFFRRVDKYSSQVSIGSSGQMFLTLTPSITKMQIFEDFLVSTLQ